MKCLVLILVLVPVIYTYVRLLYNTDRRHLMNNILGRIYFDCLYSVRTEGKRLVLLPYCIRPAEDEMDILLSLIDSRRNHAVNDISYTFEQLEEQNVTVYNLFNWNASLDLIEQYERYLLKDNNNEEKALFHNCTNGWFGDMCQYRLYMSSTEKSFTKIINERFSMRKVATNPETILKITTGTCYLGLECSIHRLGCLDWREICDGKCDCLDRCEDEAFCSGLCYFGDIEDLCMIIQNLSNLLLLRRVVQMAG
ncbi:unnamed protein product [Didymodactylos carnosus]|uniref:Uncharacterized protein n=1 Tax=Didymodactylos carnosus TaxID=1234261 RepID=A0A8S2ESA4_9BILA|nr:unnamed protein product [Didymodactylos carnosus]CAF4101543.1 unnamed protein product [Didymodactylos carnosus]